MAIRALRDLTSSVAKVADELSRMNNELDKAANTRFIPLPASFTPPPPLGPPGTPSNPLPSDPLSPLPNNRPNNTILDSNGNPIQRPPNITTSSRASEGEVGSFKFPENPFVRPITGNLVLRKSDLEAYISMGVCQIHEPTNGVKTISCPWGMYPSIDGGVISTVSATPGGGSSPDSDGGRFDRGAGFDRTGNQDRSRRFNPNVSNTDRTRKTGQSTVTVQLDSKPITDRLDGLREDIRNLSRGDGGVSIRLRNGV